MVGGQALRERWTAWSGRFAGLQPREKYLISGAVLTVILLGGHTLWIEPGQLQAQRLKASLAQQQDELTRLRGQVASLIAQHRDPDLAQRDTLRQLHERISVVDQDLRSFDGTLVAPGQAPVLLQTLLARHRGLALVSLTTLTPRPLIEPPAKSEVGKTAAVTLPGGNLYRHGIEIKLAGAYNDLLAYVSEIEASPQKLLWGGISLSSNYPVSELTLTVYTLSLDSTWLVV